MSEKIQWEYISKEDMIIVEEFGVRFKMTPKDFYEKYGFKPMAPTVNFGEWHPVIQHIEHQVDSMTWCKGYEQFREDPIILKLNKVLLELDKTIELKKSITEELEKHLYGLKEYNER